ncbi:MAG: hypothetical protein BIFFINMI_01703 [Phycisphaerae bacterium]|nr:hypothetical protein [Phycisphaerae bacterium]
MSSAWRLTTGVLCALLAGLAGCAKPETTGQTVTPKGAETTRELLDRLHEVSRRGDLPAAVPLLEPRHQALFADIFGAMSRMDRRGLEVAAVIEQKIDKQTADGFRGQYDRSEPSPLAEAQKEDGSLDWEKVKVTERGDTATVAVNGRPLDVKMVRAEGRWYLSPGDDEALPTPEQVAQGKRAFDAMIGALDKIEAGVKDGSINKENFRQQMWQIQMAAMAAAMPNEGPTTQPDMEEEDDD